MTPIEYYQRLIESDQILEDDQQAMVVKQFQVIHDHLMHATSKFTLLKKLSLTKTDLTKGLYLWGDVGIGKTFLMDCFFYCLPFKNKLRIHFIKFMHMIHEQLTQLQGTTNPLKKIATQLAGETKVICFDELAVNDIADAMLLAGLFDALYKERICLIFTSNSSPDNLYLKGLQRGNFLPAIELLKKNSEVIHITTQSDYRLQNYADNTFYYTPLDNDAEQKLQTQFSLLSKQPAEVKKLLRICDRDIMTRKVSEGVAWFDFLKICGVPRSQDDYLAIAKNYHTIIVSNVTAIQPEQNDLARTFISLVDVLYDTNKKLIISAEKPIEQLYRSGRMLFEFARTRSRLIEMQTMAWHNKCDHNFQLALAPCPGPEKT
ncbi:MAG: AFG1 family ATPase [Gammaproteobacteria bacterium]|nr:AFG1 family ATPase [Gammaproteobacteria bacterium]